MEKMEKIILDTNAVMAIAGFKIDLFSELRHNVDFKYSLFVLKGTIDELNSIIRKQKGKYKEAAKLGLALLKVKRVGIIHHTSDKNVDDLLLDFSKKGIVVLTQDILLKKRLQKPYLTIRQKKKIVLVK